MMCIENKFNGKTHLYLIMKLGTYTCHVKNFREYFFRPTCWTVENLATDLRAREVSEVPVSEPLPKDLPPKYEELDQPPLWFASLVNCKPFIFQLPFLMLISHCLWIQKNWIKLQDHVSTRVTFQISNELFEVLIRKYFEMTFLLTF